MDPNAALQNAREALARYEAADPDGENEAAQAADDLAVSFGALDDWLSKGGFLPAEWEK